MRKLPVDISSISTGSPSTNNYPVLKYLLEGMGLEMISLTYNGICHLFCIGNVKATTATMWSRIAWNGIREIKMLY